MYTRTCQRARPRISHSRESNTARPIFVWTHARGKEPVVTTCNEPGSNHSSRVLHLPLHHFALGAAGRRELLVVQLHPGRKAIAPSPCNCTFTMAPARPNTKRIENQKEDEDAVEKKDEDWAHDCTIDIVSPHLGSCITRHTHLIGSL